MSTAGSEAFVSCRDELLASILQARERAKIGRAGEEKLGEINEQLSNYTEARAYIFNTIEHLTKMYKNVEAYLEQKRTASVAALEEAIMQAGYLVPSADVAGMHLALKGKRARIVNSEEVDLNIREGSAYRAIASLLIRRTLLRFQPNALQMIVLDEAFATVSAETAVVLRPVLEILKEELLIIGIEQHNFVYEGLEKLVITAVKYGKETQIRAGE